MASLQSLGVERALVVFKSTPISLLLTKPAQMHWGLYSRTVSIPSQHDFTGLVSFDPMLRYERQSSMPNITVEQSEFDGPGAGEPTWDCDGDFALLRAWIGVMSDDDDSNNNKMERTIDCFMISYCRIFVCREEFIVSFC